MRNTLTYLNMRDLLTPDEMELFSEVAETTYGDAAFTLITFSEFYSALGEMGLSDERMNTIFNQYQSAAQGLPVKTVVYVNLEA